MSPHKERLSRLIAGLAIMLAVIGALALSYIITV
jgi:hypothetical protein